VAWQHSFAQALPSIEAMRVMVNGDKRDAQPFIVTTSIANIYGTPGAETAAAVVSAGNGHALVLLSRVR
jgi:hypothetical protein